MAKHGAPTMTPPNASHLNVAIITAQWHNEIITGLLEGAQRACADADVSAAVVQVPGTVELTVAASRLASSGFDAIVALGVVIRGGTPHFDYVCLSVTHGLTDVSTMYGIPVGFGVLTCDSEEQARDRAGLDGSSEDKGYEAAAAAITTAVTLNEIAPIERDDEE